MSFNLLWSENLSVKYQCVWRTYPFYRKSGLLLHYQRIGWSENILVSENIFCNLKSFKRSHGFVLKIKIQLLFFDNNILAPEIRHSRDARQMWVIEIDWSNKICSIRATHPQGCRGRRRGDMTASFSVTALRVSLTPNLPLNSKRSNSLTIFWNMS